MLVYKMRDHYFRKIEFKKKICTFLSIMLFDSYCNIGGFSCLVRRVHGDADVEGEAGGEQPEPEPLPVGVRRVRQQRRGVPQFQQPKKDYCSKKLDHLKNMK